MSNSTPPNAPAEEQAREQAEAALKRQGWIPGQWDSFGRAEDAGTRDGSYSLRLYPADVPDAPRAALCRIDDWTRKDDSGDISPYMWVLGVPCAEEVPALLSEFPEATGWGEDGAIWDRILDLQTGEVVTEKEAQRLLRDPVLKVVRGVRRSIAEREEILRELVAAGWELVYVRVNLYGEPQVSDIGASGTGTKLGGFGTPNYQRLRMDLWGDGVREIYVDDPGHGVEVPVGNGKIPTPDEAYEAYYRELRQPGKMITNEYQVYQPRRNEDATR